MALPTAARLPPAGPRDRARVRRHPGRDAVHERREPRLDGPVRRRQSSPPRRSRSACCRTTSVARLFCFLDPYADPQGACYQLVQALNAVGSGGWLGRGLTVGGEDQRGYIPVQSTDFIFTVVAEDLGFVGGDRGPDPVRRCWCGGSSLIGWRARDAFGMLIAVGLASMILFQVVVNIGMVIGVMPVTGIPLPFVTYGGSRLISLLFGHGHPPVGPDAHPTERSRRLSTSPRQRLSVASAEARRGGSGRGDERRSREGLASSGSTEAVEAVSVQVAPGGDGRGRQDGAADPEQRRRR